MRNRKPWDSSTRAALAKQAAVLPAIVLVGLALGSSSLTAHAELIDRELRQHRRMTGYGGLIYGSGTARLDGMGLSLAVRDENDEINLFDYGDNPAGLLTDRDAWSVDFRFGHDELRELSPELNGFLFKSNSYTFFGTTRSGQQAFGGGADYLDSSIERRTGPQAGYKNGRLRFIYGRQAAKFDIGAELRYLSEDQSISDLSTIYPISHSTGTVTGLVGLSYRVHEHIRIAGRGTLRSTTIDGVAATDSHNDQFTWDRPAGSLEGQLFVSSPGLEGAVTLGRLEGAGEENLDASWSLLFDFNPTLRPVEFSRRTFTEELAASRFRTRWRYDITPDFLTLAASFDRQTSTRVSTASRLTLGSEPSSDVKQSFSDLGLGGSLHLLRDRLLVAGEFHAVVDEFENRDPFEGYQNKETSTNLGFGVEYLVRENFAARAGIRVRNDDRDFEQGLSGTYGSSAASFGIGLIPSGGALQLDASYSRQLGSELDIEENHVTMYARLLF